MGGIQTDLNKLLLQPDMKPADCLKDCSPPDCLEGRSNPLRKRKIGPPDCLKIAATHSDREKSPLELNSARGP
jgi:hypothetical protein